MAASPKLWKSYKWMHARYVKDRLTEREIAKLANTDQSTINRWLKKHELNRRI